MMHPSDEQLDTILHGERPADEHLAQCALCQDRLAERRAIGHRLRSAFDGVRAPEGLADRIRRQADETSPKGESTPAATTGRTIPFRRWLLPATAAAAVVLLAVSAILIFTTPESATAAQAELYRMHQHGLSPDTELHADANPEVLAGYLKNRLGFKPAVPRLGKGMSLRGCCVAHFRDKPVGSYVVDTPRGVISIIVVTESPESLGMKETIQRGGHAYGAGSFAKCEMVTVKLGAYTYCAVGEVSRDLLADLLEQLVW